MQLPYNLDAEIAVLGSVLIDSNMAVLAFPKLRPEYFYDGRNRMIYQAVQELNLGGYPVDMVSVSNKLQAQGNLDKVGGMPYLSGLIEPTHSTLHVEYYADLVAGYAKLRQLASTSAKFLQDIGQTSPLEVQNLIDSLTAEIFDSSMGLTNSRAVDSKTVMNEFWDDFSRRYESGVHVELSTGYDELDAVVGGYNKGNLVILAGRPSQGKTALMLCSLLKVAQSGVPVAIFSYEMSRLELAQRWNSMFSGVPLVSIRTASGIGDKEMDSLVRATGQIAEMPIVIDPNPFGDLLYLMGAIRRYVLLHKVKVVGIDYLQIMPMRGDDLVNEIGHITRTLKLLSQSLGITIILISQLNRSLEARADKKPKPSDLRQSGRIEEDADTILMVYRDIENSPEDGEIGIAKNRNGPTGTVNLFFVEETASFEGRKR